MAVDCHGYRRGFGCVGAGMSAIEISIGITAVALALLMIREFLVQGRIRGANMIALIVSFGVSMWFIARIAGAA